VADNGDGKRPQPPSPDQYKSLQQGADELRQTRLAEQSAEARRRAENRGGMQAYVRYTGIGLQFTLMMLLPLGGGYWLDSWLGTLPWLTVAGAVLGAVGGMVWVVKSVFRMENRSENRDPDGKKDR
jgi:F0F1-type ATP synthase assembly protein I